MMRSKRNPLIVLACVVLAVGTAIPAAMAQTASVLRIGIQDDPDLFDPARAYSFVGRIVLTSLCNKLVDTAPDLSFVPQLALSWDTAPDGMSVDVQASARGQVLRWHRHGRRRRRLQHRTQSHAADQPPQKRDLAPSTASRSSIPSPFGSSSRRRSRH